MACIHSHFAYCHTDKLAFPTGIHTQTLTHYYIFHFALCLIRIRAYFRFWMLCGIRPKKSARSSIFITALNGVRRVCSARVLANQFTPLAIYNLQLWIVDLIY